LDDELLINWYAVHINTTHPKLKPIPLGVCHNLNLATQSGTRQTMEPVDYDSLLARASRMQKSKEFNVSFSIWSNFPARNACLKAAGMSSIDLDLKCYIEDLGASRYCLSPEGLVIDCHRTWEALYCKTIPVITWNPMVNMGLYDGLPVIILNQWEDFNIMDFTHERYERMIRDFDPASLRLDRWITEQQHTREPSVFRSKGL
jgi:hypothetical protein